MSEHLDLDLLADLLAGEGTDEGVVAHLRHCAGCSGRLDELAAAEEEVVAALAALPPPPVPAGLADRLAAALAAEPALAPTSGPPDWARADDEPGSGDEPREGARTVTPFPAERRRSWSPLAAAASLLLLAGAVGGGLALASRGGGVDSTTSAAPGGAAESADLGIPISETGQDYAADGALAAALPDLLGGTAPTAATLESQPQSDGDAGGSAADQDQSVTSLQERAGGDGGLDRLREPPELASCLDAVLPPEDDAARPLAVDYAAYGGEPALVVVLPATGAPDKVDVFVVGSGCRQGDDQTRFFARLDRP
jgi:hypothetical protein